MQPIYLNHAGTSWPKPPEVVAAATDFLHSDPREWPARFAEAHQVVARLFHVDPARLLLTPSCTGALNLAVSDHAWEAGDRVLTSHYEHHAMVRALTKLEERGVEVSRLPAAGDELVDLEALDRQLNRGGVRLVALTAASNVTGQLLPLDEVITRSHAHDARVLVDGAQVAGWWDLDVNTLGADLFTFAGHKGPQAPWGIGGLIVAPGLAMSSPNATCELTPGATVPCAPMPGYCDAGSVNLVALAGMEAACHALQGSLETRLSDARALADRLAQAIRSMSDLTIHGDVAWHRRMPTVAVTSRSLSPSELGQRLKAEGVIASAGFQCAPEAHQALGTAQTGVVRFSFGPPNRAEEVDRVVEVLEQLTTASTGGGSQL